MNLSKRELQILELMSYGYSDKEIGVKLVISDRTVQSYVNRIILKMDARNRIAAVANYIRSCMKASA